MGKVSECFSTVHIPKCCHPSCSHALKASGFCKIMRHLSHHCLREWRPLEFCTVQPSWLSPATLNTLSQLHVYEFRGAIWNHRRGFWGALLFPWFHIFPNSFSRVQRRNQQPRLFHNLGRNPKYLGLISDSTF